MEDIKQDSITAFDTCFTNNHIRMLKVLLPFLNSPLQQNLAVYIKFQELQYVFHSFKESQSGYNRSFQSKSTHTDFDFNIVCNELLPYCNSQEKRQFTQIRNLIQTMHNLQDMMNMMETMKELFPEGTNGESGFNPEILSGLGNMFGGGNMDFSQMADLFQAFQGNS